MAGFSQAVARLLRRKMSDEEGSISALSLQLLLVAMVLGGLAVDVQNGFQMQTQLQVTADAAAHAALIKRQVDTAANAKAKGVTLASHMMPSTLYGNVVQTADIKFGSWNANTRVFTVDDTKTGAVFVAAKRYASNKNAMSTLFLRLIGRKYWDIQADSVFVTYQNPCGLEGFSSQKMMDMQSNGHVHADVCFSSNDHVKISSNNTFDSGSIVQMPDKNDVQLPASGFTTNPGLQAALTDGVAPMRILSMLDAIIAGVQDPTSVYFRSYSDKTKPVVNSVKPNPSAWKKTTFQSGRIYNIDCKSNGSSTLTFDSPTNDSAAPLDLTGVTIVTDCEIKFGKYLILQDTFFGTTSTSSKSVQDSASLTFGKNDNCADGGGVQIVTKGSVFFTSAQSLYGVQILAAGDVSLTANGSSQGMNIVAGGYGSVTSNGDWNSCNQAGTADNFKAPYFRLAG